jgi:hypothetical protein
VPLYFQAESELAAVMLCCRAAPRALALAFGLSLALAAPTALAQERDVAAAQAMFDQARELAEQGKYEEACPKFQESNRLDPGIGTQFHLADCYEHSGRLASAWALFVDVAAQARVSGQLDREKVLLERAQQLQPRLPKLQVNVPEASKTAGLEIRRNGILVGSAQWGTPMPIDPGDVELSIAAPGKQTLRQTVRLEEGKIFSYSVPALAESTSPSVTAAAAPSPSPAAPSEPAPKPAADGGERSSRRPTALILGLAGAGVVGLGVSGVFAVLAKNKDSDSKEHCHPTPNQCTDEGIELRNDAIRRGNTATVAFIAGGALLAGAGVVWLVTGGSDDPPNARHARVWASPGAAPGYGGVQLAGSF